MSSQEDIALLIKTIQYRHHRRLDAALADLGISLVQWNALREIARNPGASMHALAEATFNSDQGFGTLAKRLLDAGLILRRQGNGRALTHDLTEEGRRLLDQGALRYKTTIDDAFRALSAEQLLDLQNALMKLT
ncbi:MAG: MarR family transcriptional regulator [Sphingomonas sp.]|uniref:MarR family winged helix-turn-helix transcriptional regulator n=1 Tax=Sphingomonas sp. TaxID=28214 RepID=UPI001ACA9449|nr:MarR family transcriptional regulator [Sphingomonas sp.]MBN8809414.1 MarR family transcriptional regulator [Sphingomonas sp.]